ncbi:MAG: hypothetical protein ACR2LH_11115, partial [Thermoleophilaceae bacterium]
GLGDTPAAQRPLEVTLWGEPRCGRTGTRLADGTRLRWDRGALGSSPARALTVVEPPGTG